MEEYQKWKDSLPTTSFSKGFKKPKEVEAYQPPKAYVRGDSCTKPVHGKVYTGNKMIGIGTLHKSNAVPIFSDEDAKDQASMRR
jgi:hypothetical protein